MPAGLLINEMLTNALKYAFVGRSSGQLKLICRQDGGRVTVIVPFSSFRMRRVTRLPVGSQMNALPSNSDGKLSPR